MAYVYRHIRLDTNHPFYIGISKFNDEEYSRAYDKKGRNIFWHRVANKVIFEVEIMIDNITWEQACEKEVEFIKLYGRVNLKTGILVNCTDGGQGMVNLSPETRKILSDKAKANETGRKHPEWRNEIKSISQGGENHWAFGTKMKKETLDKKSESMKKKYLNGYVHPMTGHKMSDEQKLHQGKNSMKPLMQYSDTGGYIRDWDSGKQAAFELKISASAFPISIRNGWKVGGCIWKYK